MIDREDASPLGEDEYYIGDMIGMDVYTDDPGEHFGVSSGRAGDRGQ